MCFEVKIAKNFSLYWLAVAFMSTCCMQDMPSNACFHNIETASCLYFAPFFLLDFVEKLVKYWKWKVVDSEKLNGHYTESMYYLKMN